MSDAHPRAATHALLAALLEQGSAIHRLSCVLTALSLASLGLSSIMPFGPIIPALAAGAALLGASETYLATRVGFDAAIFRLVAAGRVDWEGVDRGLSDLNLATPKHPSRSDESRAKGALRLLRRQGSATILQGLLILAALILAYFHEAVRG